MGYATIQHVPTIRDYAQAKKIHDSIKPLRGRNPEKRPLGQRRDADTYSIRINAAGDVECVLYQTPVVTFKQDGTVLLYTGGYNTTSTNQFISEVLGFGAYRQCKHMIITPNFSSEKHVIVGDKVLLRPTTSLGRRWDVEQAEKLYGYRMDRAQANSVMARYADFVSYFNGMVKVRRENHSVPHIVMSGTEYAAVGMTRWKQDNSEWLVERVKEDKDGTFYEAFLYIALEALGNWASHSLLQHKQVAYKVTIENMREKMRMLILRHHAREVLHKKELPNGKIPNPKYFGWIKD